MNTVEINQDEAINLLKNNKDLSLYSIKFNSHKIEAKTAFILGKNNIDVPSQLIYYNDESIDYSDDPPITEEDLLTGKLQLVESEEQAIDSEIKEWAKENKINLSILMRDLLRNFYHTMKIVQKKTVL